MPDKAINAAIEKGDVEAFFQSLPADFDRHSTLPDISRAIEFLHKDFVVEVLGRGGECVENWEGLIEAALLKKEDDLALRIVEIWRSTTHSSVEFSANEFANWCVNNKHANFLSKIAESLTEDGLVLSIFQNCDELETDAIRIYLESLSEISALLGICNEIREMDDELAEEDDRNSLLKHAYKILTEISCTNDELEKIVEYLLSMKEITLLSSLIDKHEQSGIFFSKYVHLFFEENSLLYKILKLGADIDYLDNDGNSILMLAAKKGDLEKIKFLIKNGAAINLQNAAGATPLFRALQKKRVEAAVLLLDAGADTKTCDNKGRSPLDIAKQCELRTIVARLESLDV